MNSVARISPKLSWRQKQELARQALRAANDLRMREGGDLFEPICPFSLCESLDIYLRFTPGNLEGAFFPGDPERIFVSADRALARRRFTCAHEIAHREFRHGATLDELRTEIGSYNEVSPEEFLADAFAGHLLMPVMGIRGAFQRRGLKPDGAPPAAIWAVATEFGVGFDTLLTQLAFVMRDISAANRAVLQRARSSLRSKILQGRSGGNLLFIDQHFATGTLDIEVGQWVLAPVGTDVEGCLVADGIIDGYGSLFKSTSRGRAILQLPGRDQDLTVRVSPRNFVGLAQYRFLDNDDEAEAE